MTRTRSLPVPRHVCAAILAFATAQSLATPANAAYAPHLVITREHWKSSSGDCTVDLQHASVAGVPAGMKTLIDGVLAGMLTSQAPSAALTLPKREAGCATGHRSASYENADWTIGLAGGRWLSARLHVSGYTSGQVHPWEGYAAVTFDLTHGGNPVPKGGFYTNAQRAKLEQILANAEIEHLKVDDGDDHLDAAKIDYVRKDVHMSDFKASDFLLTRTGLEATGIITADAEGMQIIKVPYSALRAVGTPGGPLDPATR